MTFTFRPAVREDVPLLIGVAGGTGSGKTLSALKVARGLAGGKPFAVLDTESGRAKMYADHCQPWHHGDLAPPFTPARYGEAIAAAESEGYPVIVVDSFSHEHAGDGGLLDMQEDELQRMAGDDPRKREAVKMAAWIKPKREHKRLVSQLLQMRAHIVIALRAEEKVEIGKENGKTVVRPKRSLTGLDGWVPVCEKTLPFELTASFLLTADRPGIPRPIKLNDDHRPLVPLDRPLSEQVGQALAQWAAGTSNGHRPEPPQPLAMLDDATLAALRRAKAEANVNGDWLQKQMKALGVKNAPKRVTWRHIKALKPDQAQGLLVALNSVVDEREEF